MAGLSLVLYLQEWSDLCDSSVYEMGLRASVLCLSDDVMVCVFMDWEFWLVVYG